MRPIRDPLLKGRYTTNRDGGLTYEYEGFWFRAGDTIVWRGRVRREGKLKGAPHGQITDADTLRQTFAVRDAVTELITAAIEYLVQVEK